MAIDPHIFLQLKLYDTIIKSFTTLMTSFAEGIGKRLSSRKLSDAQIMRAIADGINAVDLLIPAAHEQLSVSISRRIFSCRKG